MAVFIPCKEQTVWLQNNAILKKKSDLCYSLLLSKPDKGWSLMDRAGLLHVWIVWNPVGNICFSKCGWCIFKTLVCCGLLLSRQLVNEQCKRKYAGRVKSYCTNWGCVTTGWKTFFVHQWSQLGHSYGTSQNFLPLHPNFLAVLLCCWLLFPLFSSACIIFLLNRFQYFFGSQQPKKIRLCFVPLRCQVWEVTSSQEYWLALWPCKSGSPPFFSKAVFLH